ncbi:hypothetical protein [Mesorhizobium australicum]|uniref:hypothetical protein n=1 Tax=Mesorhizobium australicum TaxID=536018 RepID=UPI003335A623
MKTDGEAKAKFFESMRFRFNKCLFPTINCPNDAIRAHSVQKATSLSLIEETGHVCEIKMKIDGDQPVCKFARVGRNEASTFTGLCNEHDTQLFRPIDTKPLKLGDPEQMFLVAYRSATRELHAAMLGAIRVQTTLQNLVKLGRVEASEASPAMMAATQALLKSWLVWRYRFQHYDRTLAKGDYSSIMHSTFSIAGHRPVLASSSYFPIDDVSLSKKTVWIALNVIPVGEEDTEVIFSYPKALSGPARRRIASVMTKTGEDQLSSLSTLVLDSTENFFMRPSHIEGWPDEKRQRIEEAFFSTVTKGAVLQPSPELMLF